ncbi:MAG: PP2C family protein-serine/threonine phosphatase [Kiloniellaceae bacterium]
MSNQHYLKAAEDHGGSLSKQLEFIGDLGTRLAEADDPVGLLEAEAPGVSNERDAAFDRAMKGLSGLAHANAALRRRLTEQLRAGDSLEMAADLQQSLQPNSVPGLQPIWGVNLPARKVSGDFFDFYRLDKARIAFALGDVSGKGMNAALLMAKTISLFRCLSKRIDTPAGLLQAINEELCETASRGMFVTMVAGHYWIANGRVCLANAGHQPPLLRRRDRSYTAFPAAAPPLGIATSTCPAEEWIDLDGGELYTFTDGLTEYRYKSGEQLGVDGLIQLIEAVAEAPLARRLESLLETLDQDDGWEARDDLTVLAIDDSWVRSDAGVNQAESGDQRVGGTGAPGLRSAAP